MPSSIIHQCARYHIEDTKIGRALAHPARLRILEILSTKLIW